MPDEIKTPKPPALPVGGQVAAIVPQSVEEIFRVAKGVVQSGLAPFSLIKNKALDAQVSAVAIVFMAGAELGMPPMASLRSFTVIGGRPALYGDGLINAVRRSKMAKRISTGFTPGKDAEFGDDAFGWCEAERFDTGETKRVEFTVGDAKRAGLWDERAMAPQWDRDEKKYIDKANEAPWYRYPKRMLPWRAAGYCLRELFGDVLGGVTDEYEAREIAVIEGTYEVVVEPPSPPSAPAPQTGGKTPAEIITDLNYWMEAATDPEGVERVWSDMGVSEEFEGDETSLAEAETIRTKHLARVTHPEFDEDAAAPTTEKT